MFKILTTINILIAKNNKKVGNYNDFLAIKIYNIIGDKKDITNYYKDPCLLVEFYDPEFKHKRPEGVRCEDDWHVDEVKPSEIRSIIC